MGQWFSLMWNYWFPNHEYKLVMVGLDNAGKTTSLYQLTLGQAVVTGPTVGSNVEQLEFENMTFEIWDLGGQSNLRPSWSTYYRHTDAVIMVVDSTDKARVSTAKEELFKLLDSEALTRTPVLVLANKQDLRTAMSVTELTEALALHSIKKHDWHIQGCCALTGQGLLDGVSWIAQRVNPSTSRPSSSGQTAVSNPAAAAAVSSKASLQAAPVAGGAVSKGAAAPSSTAGALAGAIKAQAAAATVAGGAAGPGSTAGPPTGAAAGATKPPSAPTAAS